MHRARSFLFVCAGICLLALAYLGFASPGHAGTWAEPVDAPSLPAAAQLPVGSGALDLITGTIDFGDVDMFEIHVTGGGTFSAFAYGAPPLYLDPTLCLFDSHGVGVYANDNTWPPDPFYAPGSARLPAAHALTPTVAGTYFLAISGIRLEPGSSGGPVFPCLGCNPGPNSVYGPTGSGGGSPITGWFGSPFTAGPYTIQLTGAEFAQRTTAARRDSWGGLKTLYR